MSEDASDGYFTLQWPFDQYCYNQHVSNNAHMACLKLFEYTEKEIKEKEGNQKRKKQTGIFNFLQ